MTVQISTVNVGSVPNDHTGDSVRNGFIKYNNTVSNLKITLDNVSSTYANTNYGVFGNLSVTNSVLGSLHFSGADTVYINGSPVATAASNFSGGNVALQANFLSATSSTSSNTGAVVVTGGVGIGGNLNVAGAINVSSLEVISGNLVAASTTDAGSTTNASLISLGGIGVVKSAIIGQALTVSGATSLNSILDVAGITNITSSATTTNSTTGALVVTGGVGIGGNLYVATQGTINGNLLVNGNLNVVGSALYGTQSLAIGDNIVDLHTFANLAPITFDDGLDIGFTFHYYKPGYGDSHAFLGWANDSGSLEYYARGNEVSGDFVGVSYGNYKGGSFQSVNTTPATSTTTGAIITAGGAGIAGNLYAGGNVVATGNVIAGNINSTGRVTGTGFFYANGTPFVSSSGYGNSNVATYLGALTTSIVPSANVTYNLGSSSAWFNTFYGVSTQAQYADLAEKYVADAEYDPGTVVVFGGSEEITTTNQFADVSVAGAISTDPAYLMNSLSEGLPVALRGRIPVKVVGPVYKGDLLVTAGANPGYAVSVGKSTDYPLAVFAKSIETNTDKGTKVITAVII